MKIKILFLMTCLFAIVVSSVTFAAPQSYPMKCRGAGNSALTVTSNKSGTILTFIFDRSAYRGLEGSCGWQDRNVANDEPNRLSMRFPKVITSVTLAKRTNGEMGFKHQLLGGGTKIDRANLEKVIRAFRDGNTFVVQAYSDRSTGYLIVTNFGA